MYDYVKTFRGKSISTQDWQSHLFAYFGKQPNGSELTDKLNKVNWDGWLRGTGLELPVKMEYDTTLADAAYNLSAKWDAARKKGEFGFSSSDLDNFTSSQTGTLLQLGSDENAYTVLTQSYSILLVVFLETLESYDALPSKYLKEMNRCYNFDSTSNAEIRLRWYNVSLKGDGEDFKHAAAEWVVTVGRMKVGFATLYLDECYNTSIS